MTNEATDAEAKSKSNGGPSKGATKAAKASADSKGARFDVGALRVALARVAGVSKVSRPDLAKLIGAHPNSIALWESGTRVGENYLTKLRDLDARIAKGEKISISQKRKGGRPAKAVAKKTSGRRKPAARKAAAKKLGRPAKSERTFDVKALRTKLGASRDTLAKLLGVSAGSVLNWELHGTKITQKNVARLRELAARTAKGEVRLPERKRGGRPKKFVAAPAPAPKRKRIAKLAITGDARILYANVIAVTESDGNVRLRFGLAVPGEAGARAVADVVVPRDVLPGPPV